MKLKYIISAILTIYSLSSMAAISKSLIPALNKPTFIETGIEQPGSIDFSKPKIAKCAIASLMGRPLSKMKVKQEGTIYIVTYIREDGEHLAYKIKFDRSEILWGKADGRWRDTAADEKLRYSIKPTGVFIHIMYSDGSSETKKY